MAYFVWKFYIYIFAPRPMPTGIGEGTLCPLPSIVRAGDEPLQTVVPAGMSDFELSEFIFKPLAGFSVDARVLSRKDYTGTNNASRVSRTDLALGWKVMSRDDILAQIKISQSGRWAFWRAKKLPITEDDINFNFANMHLIPSSRAIAKKINQVKKDDRVRIDGWLIEIHERKTSRVTWRSSVSRTDTGDGACELVYVCNIIRY